VERSTGSRWAVRVRAESRNESHVSGAGGISRTPFNTTIPRAMGYHRFPILNTKRGQIPLDLV
jgi:hypothetical protein